jgi:hypothetical protein
MTAKYLAILAFITVATAGCKTTDSSLSDAASCPVPPSNSSCQYYECLEKEYQCGTTGYPHGYGEKYCKKFQGSCDGKLTTPESKQWIRGTTKCLQKDIEDAKQNLPSCAAVSDHAFKSHSYCYTKGSALNGGRNFCSLGPLAWRTVLGCVDGNDRYSGDALRQIRGVAANCISFFGGGFFLDESSDEILDEEAKDVVRGLSDQEKSLWSEAISGLIDDIDQRLGQTP